MKKRLFSFAGILIFFIVWYGISEMGIFRPYVFPSPGKVVKTLVEMAVSGEIVEDIVISFLRVVTGFLISFVIAFLLGVIRVLFPKSEQFYDFFIQFFRNVPPLAMIPLLILWFGIGEVTKILIIILASFFPMFLSIEKGFLTCDKRLIEVGMVFGYGNFERFLKIILPSALADILVGMRIGMGYSWRAIIGAEMVAASTGLGHMILFAQQMSRTDKVIVGICVIGMVGYMVDKAFGLVIRSCVKGAGEDVFH